MDEYAQKLQVEKEVKFAELRVIDRIGMLKQYFMRGHQYWISFFISIGTFIVVSFNFLVVELVFVPDILKDFWVFTIAFSVGYFLLASIVGFYDIKRGTFYSQEYILGKHSPIWQANFDRQDKILRNQEILMKQNARIAKELNITFDEQDIQNKL